MASLNRVFLIGNLTRDPELRYIPSGTAVTDFGLAVNQNWTGKDGQKHEDVVFVDVTLWARQAELACEYLTKGRSVFIEGRLQLDQWQDKDGQKRSKMRVVGERMQFLGAPPGKGGESADHKAPPPEEFG
ncbi:MAG: single-stranded DNA-binding protein, partial [Planctomycetes bacterium]|nr:single-stranded DNA-binding protein [Planctomycetota bacterium]